MKRVMLTAVLASALALTVPLSASAGNPIFGNAKVQTLDTKQMKSVVGQNTTSIYYAYLGNFYGSAAIQYSTYGMYLESFPSYKSTQNSYYSYAQSYAYAAYVYYYYAYITN